MPQKDGNNTPTSQTGCFNRLRYKIAPMLTAIGEFCNSFVNNGYWIAQACDAYTGYNQDSDNEFLAELSLPAFIVGCTASFATTLGSVYAHYKLNVNYSPEATTPSPDTEPPNQLTCLQKFAIASDFMSHTGDGAGLPIMIFSLIEENPSRSAAISIQAGATAFGVITAIAYNRTCKNNLKFFKKYQHINTENNPVNLNPDWSVVISAIGEFLNSFLNNGYWIAQAYDAYLGHTQDDGDDFFAGLSTFGIITGSLISFFITCSSVYSHYVMNINHKNAGGQFDREAASLTWMQRLISIGDYISHVGEGADLPMIVFNLISPDPSRIDKIIVHACSTFYGTITAYSNNRTCRENLLIYNNLRAKHRSKQNPDYQQLPDPIPTEKNISTEHADASNDNSELIEVSLIKQNSIILGNLNRR